MSNIVPVGGGLAACSLGFVRISCRLLVFLVDSGFVL